MTEKYQAANDNFEDVSTTNNVVYSDKLTRRNFVSETISDTMAYMKEVRLSITDQIQFKNNAISRANRASDFIQSNHYKTRFTEKTVKANIDIAENWDNLLDHDVKTLELLNHGLSTLLINLTQGTALEVKQVMSLREQVAKGYFDRSHELSGQLTQSYSA